MDLKCIQLIHNIHDKILNQSFDEIDICTLLILIRDETTVNHDYMKIEWEYGFLREVCNFVAHRNRNKGFVFEEARYTYKHCTTTGVFHTDTESKRTILSGMFEDVIINELNNVFKKYSLAPIPKNCECEIILCIISLLQFSHIMSDDGNVHGYLYVEICDDGIYLLNDIFEAGASAIILRVEDARYYHLVVNNMSLTTQPFYLKRIGTELKVIIPNCK